MTEPEQIDFQERVTVAGIKPDGRSLPTRIGIVAGSAVLVVIGAVAGMGASPSTPATSDSAELTIAVMPGTSSETVPLDGGLRGGFGRGGFHGITIGAISGSSLSLETEDGWSRTITVGSSTTITRGGGTIAFGDLAVGDQIGFSQERASDGTYSITAIKVILPSLGGEVTAISDGSITVNRKDGTTGTIHVDGDTTYGVNGDAAQALSDIEVGDFVVAEGTLRTDGSLDADVVHSGRFGRHGFGPGRGPWNRGADPNATPTPTPSSTAS